MKNWLAYSWVLKFIKPFLKIGWYGDHALAWLLSYWKRRRMLKIAVVGDLSMNNPTKYDHVMSEAFKNADMVVQIGDMHPAYDITTKYLNNKDKKVLLAVPGNHDVEWDEKYPHPRQWVYT